MTVTREELQAACDRVTDPRLRAALLRLARTLATDAPVQDDDEVAPLVAEMREEPVDA